MIQAEIHKQAVKDIAVHKCWESQSATEFWFNEVVVVGIKETLFWDSQKTFLEIFNILMEMQDSLEDWRLGMSCAYCYYCYYSLSLLDFRIGTYSVCENFSTF